MGTTQEKYDIRPGTVDSGKEFEVKTIALLALRCVLHGVDEMWIAFNADGIGAFDDITLHVETSENEPITFMMQLKHKDNRKNIQEQEFLHQRGDFSLKKYSQGIYKLQQSISSNSKIKLVERLGPLDNIYFVFFTNRVVYENSDILVDSNGPEKSIHFLKNVLNTNTTTNSLFGFKLDTLPDIAKNNNFNNVFLLANQLSSEHIDQEIANRIKEIIDPTGVSQVDIKGMAQNFMQYVKDWARGTLGGHYCLTKQDVLFKISELLFAQYAVNLRQHQFTFYDDDKKSMWNQIMYHETITVVESNNVVLEFLRMYIGSEVKKYCKVSNEMFWSESLTNQNLFYQTNQDLKEDMLKIVGNFGEITLVDVYKCLWMSNKLPLLLEVTRIEDYESILHVLKFTNYSYKVIVINNSTENLPSNQIETNIFCAVKDLPADCKAAILNLPIKLQSRTGVVLGNVIDESMLHYIKGNDVINILLNNFNIGNTLNQLPSYFIERSFLKTFIKAQAVRELNEDIFILDNRSNLYFSLFPQNDFNACKLEDIDFDILNNYKAILQENDEPELIKKIKSAGKTIHYLSMHDQNSFQWKWSSGSAKNIKPYQIQEKAEYERDIVSCFSNRVNIISDIAGMGKSTLMDFVQHKAPTNKWVIRVNLTNYQKYFYDCKNSNIDACKHLRYFNDTILSKQSPSSKLSQMVFEKLLITKDIIIILDGFDEVSFSHEDEVLKIAKSLYLEGYHIWLTTRPHMKSDLEEHFETFSLGLKPFNEENQHQFLTKVFRFENSELVLESEFLLKTFVEKLSGAARKNLSDLDAKFTGIPLQGKLLADVFNEDCRNYLLSKGATCFNETFDLVYLYQNFIDKKIEILCNKFGSSAIDLHNLYRKHQAFFALKLLYPNQDFIEKHVNKELDEHYKREPGKIQLLQRDGIITVDEKLNINCVHRTFAEFLVATWISENINCEQGHIQDFIHDIFREQLRLRIYNQFFYSMLDRLLAYNSPVHLAIINRQIETAKEIIRLNFNNAIEVLDKGGKSILHIISIYGVQFPYDPKDDFEIQNFEFDDMLATLKTIPGCKIRELAIKKDMLGCSPMDYAILNRSFAIANQISSKIETVLPINVCLLNHYFMLCPLDYVFLYTSLSDRSDIYADEPFIKVGTILPINYHLLKDYADVFCMFYCLKFNFQPLFKVLLPYLVCSDLLIKIADLEENVLKYISGGCGAYDNINHFLHSYKKITLSQVIQSESSYPYSGFTNNHYSDLRFAIAFGTKQNVLKLLSQGIDVNVLDNNNNAPLHYAVLHGKSKTIKTLLLNGAQINTQGSEGNTPLHLAVMQHISIITPCNSINPRDAINFVTNKRYYSIAFVLLSKGADVNKQNDYGETPLHVLIGGVCNINYDKRISSLYINNAMDLVKLLISYDASVNIENQYERTVVHVEGKKKCSNEFFRELLPKLLDNIETNRWVRTALHAAVLNGNCDLAKILLLNGADINKPNDSGFTSLHLAKTREMATLLISKGANIHLETENGETALHLHASCGRVGIVNRLLRKGLDVNKKTKNGDTALHLAVVNSSKTKTFNYECTIDLLLRNGADITIKNASRKTPLDIVSDVPHSVKVLQLLSSK